jgi:hypothetical protein
MYFTYFKRPTEPTSRGFYDHLLDLRNQLDELIEGP